ncbi:MAG: arsenite methyltransferase [Gemmataceae bacterium]|nr:arsenite methyltransferase [Gemmataceae bacterium]
MNKEQVLKEVQAGYAAVARESQGQKEEALSKIARAFGYSEEDLAAIPSDANLGLSCGNPVALANLKPGEVVVDLGCGAGIDVMLAARKVGPTGRSIGIDMTPEMIDRAKKNSRAPIQGVVYTQVEFHLAPIDELPLKDEIADCMVSNCVINLAPDKRAVFKEMHRVLKPGGRLSISDIALKGSLPRELERNLHAYVGCISGAISLQEYETGLQEAGFSSIRVIDTRKDLNAYAQAEGQTGCCTPSMEERPGSLGSLPVASDSCGDPQEAGGGCCSPPEEGLYSKLSEIIGKYDLNQFAAAVQVYAIK